MTYVCTRDGTKFIEITLSRIRVPFVNRREKNNTIKSKDLR